MSAAPSSGEKGASLPTTRRAPSAVIAPGSPAYLARTRAWNSRSGPAARASATSASASLGDLLRVADREIADAVDVTFELVARLHRTDTRRRSGHDDVAGLERDEPGEIR